MSWNGVATGAASFQQNPYANGYSGQPSRANPQMPQYGQTSSYSQQQAGFPYPQSGAPLQPPKSFPPKKKGNPIITRYPPPPGYRGPAQPQGPFGTVQFPTPPQGHPQGTSAQASYPIQHHQAPNSIQGYSPQGYGPPQSHPSQQPFAQQPFQQQHNVKWSQPPHNYPPQPPVSQSPSYPAPQHFAQQQAGYQQFPNPPPPINTTQPAWSNTQGWQQPPGSATKPHTEQLNSFGTSPTNTQPTVVNTTAPAKPKVVQTTPTNPLPSSATSEPSPDKNTPLFLGWDDWDFDFDGAIWPKANEPVDPDLSLGVITWKPAKQMTRALPSTFEDAEEQSLKPPAEKLGNGESVSMYFTTENSYEAFLDVRKTDDWDNIKDDPAFVVFADDQMRRNLISIEDCLALRDRPDLPTSEFTEREDEDMDDSAWNIMDNLEQALSGDMQDVITQSPPPPVRKSCVDQTQEDILASLGVTGSPKPPSDEAIPVPFLRSDRLPASLPPKPPAPPSANIPPRPTVGPQRAQSYGGLPKPSQNFAVPRPYGSVSSVLPQQRPILPRNMTSPTHFEINKQAGFGMDRSNLIQDTSPYTQLKRSDSSFTRKRSLQDTEQDDYHVRQQDDHTKRKRRSQVDAAYSRR